MAHYAPVAPLQIQEYLSKYERGPYQLFLAHDVRENADKYFELYCSPTEASYYTTRILDNSVIETGEALSVEHIAEAAQAVRANVIVLPDVLMDGEATKKSCLDAIDNWTPYLQRKLVWNWKYMIVPQGKTRYEFADCASAFAAVSPHLRWWGIPRNYRMKGVGSRTEAVRICNTIRPERRIHMMGFSQDLIDDMLAAQLPAVDGIDSSAPLRAASKAIDFHLGTREIPRDEDWWETAQYEFAMPEYIWRVRRWISPNLSRNPPSL